MRCCCNTMTTVVLIVVVMCTAFVMWYVRPWMPAIAQVLAICAMVLIGLATGAAIYGALMGALALWHWQESKRQANSMIHVPEHGTYVRQVDGTFLPLMPASVHVAALSPRAQAVDLPPAQPMYPQAPPFSAISHQIYPGRLILGYTTQGPVFGDATDLLSMAFVGEPGIGKSSALLYFLAMLLLVDADIHVFDHQGLLAPLAGLLPYSGSFDEFKSAVDDIREDIREREDLWRRARRVRKPKLVLVDELLGIARWEQRTGPSASLIDLIERIVVEHRKHNVFALLAGTSLPAEVLPTLTRDNLSSRVVLNSSSTHARMAGLDEETRKLLQPMLRGAQPGTAILDVSRRPRPDLAALPHTTLADLRGILSVGGPAQGLQPGEIWTPQGTSGSQPDSFEAPETTPRVVTGSIVTPGQQPKATGKSYHLSAAEQETLVAMYRSTGSIERSLRAMRRGSRYRHDAVRVLRGRGLLGYLPDN
jgi:hypothetical protein